MGLENREYYRDGRYSDHLPGWGLHFTPVVKYLILANVLVFLLQIFVTRSPEPPADWGARYEQAQAQLDKLEEAADKDGKTGTDREKQKEALRKARRALERMMTQAPGQRISVVQEWLALDPEKTILQGQVWRLLGCAFCHHRYAIWHILFNMV